MCESAPFGGLPRRSGGGIEPMSNETQPRGGPPPRGNASPSCPRVRVLCLGNDLLGDDALGLIAGGEIRRLRPDVEVLASSASGLHLLDQIVDCDRLLVIDSIESGRAEPGTIYVLDEADIPRPRGDSPHATGLFDALALARRLGLGAPSEVKVVAVEAADSRTIGGSMDPRVAGAIGRVIELALPFLESR